MKALVAACIVCVLLAPTVLAVSKSYQRFGEQQPLFFKPKNETNQTTRFFSGLHGIVGVSVEEPAREYGPQKPFGRPKPRRERGQAPLPKGYRGLGGIAGEGPGATPLPCASFGCKPFQNIVADLSTKTYYRCHCPAAKNITKENLKCFDTPALAQKIGFQAGTC